MKHIILGVCILILLSGCATTGVQNIQMDKSYGSIKESTIAFVSGSFNVPNGSICQKAIENTRQHLSKSTILHDEYRARDIQIVNLEKNPRYITKLILNKYQTNNRNSGCKPSVIGVTVQIEDIEYITKNWKGDIDSTKINNVFRNESPKVIWKGDFTLVFSNNTKLDDLFEVILNSLDKAAVLPTKTKTIAEIKQIKALEQEKNAKIFLKQCLTNEDNLKLNYDANLKTLCIGKAGFAHVQREYHKNKKETLFPISTKIEEYVTADKACSSIGYSVVNGEELKHKLNFKQTYEQQLNEKFNRDCKIERVNGLNFLVCKNKNKKEYFIEESRKTANRIYDKTLVHVEKLCFDKLKAFNQSKDKKVFEDNFTNEEINQSFTLERLDFSSQLKDERYNFSFYNGGTSLQKDDGKFYFVGKRLEGEKTKPTRVEEYYFFLEDEKNYNLNNGKFEFTKKVVKEFDKDGYDQEGYDYRGYNKKGYNKLGYDMNGLDVHGYNKHGWNPKLRIQGKQIFDAKGYDQRGYDKNGYDKDGYDRDGWNPKLKKFRKR